MASTASTASEPLRRSWWGEVDSRPLGLFRIAFGLVLLRDALLHVPLAEPLYSRSGAVPSEVVRLLGGRPSLMEPFAEPWMAQAFFLAWAAVAAGLVLGWRTRAMTAANYLLVLSVHARNPYVLSGADDIMRLLSFWSLFLPLGRAYSLDLRAGRERPGPAWALPVRLVQVQIALVYLGAGLYKLLGEPWWDGTALSYVLQLDSMLLPPGRWLASWAPEFVLTLLTWGVVLAEVAFPVLVFLPLGQPWLCRLGVGSMVAMHLGIAVTMAPPLLDFLLVLGSGALLFLLSPVEGPPRPLRWQGIALLLVMAGLAWQALDNFRRYEPALVPPPPPEMRALVGTLGLDQDWDLFAPRPMRVDCSIAVVDGRGVDLRTGEPFRPEVLPPRDCRWKRLEQIAALQRPFPLLESWTRSEARGVTRLVAVTRRSHVPGAPPHPVEVETLWIGR